MIARGVKSRMKRSEKLLAIARNYPRLVVVMHDTPDPDAIAAGWAVKFLLEEKLQASVRLIAGGDIVRAENRHMVKLLDPPLELLDDFSLDADTGVILVDCGVEASNHFLAGEAFSLVAAIDHHQTERKHHRHGLFAAGTNLPLLDIRPQVAASATIAATYLKEQHLEPDRRLATALLYALRSETRGYETHYSRLDHQVLSWLTRRADPSLLAEIENAPLPVEYFGDLALALQSSFVYEDAIFCMLPRAAGPEIIGEVADLLIRREGISRVLCAAVCDHAVLLSVRTAASGGNATDLLRETIRGLGRGGGHAHRAGGKLTELTQSAKVPEDLQDDLRIRWLAACGIKKHRGTRLLPKREILENLS